MIRLFPHGALRARVLTLAVALGTTGTLLVAPALLLGTTAAHAQAVYPARQTTPSMRSSTPWPATTKVRSSMC